MVSIQRLIWDEGNVAHIARHEVTPAEVEEVCHGEYILREAYGGRIMLIGPTLVGRMLDVVLEPEEEGEFYCVTAHPASRKDRRIYKQEKEVKNDD